jgi:hypothetical protein
MTLARSVAVLTAVLCGLAGTAERATADSPPDSWTTLRTLDCDGETVVAAFANGGPLTSFHLVGSPEVLVPKRVQVVFPGTTEPVTTLLVPGFDKNAKDVVHCTYTDPAGRFIDLLALRR